MNVNEFLNSSGEEGNSDMDTMDMSLNCEDPELMSSEFFDSVLSLENNMEDDFGSRFLSNLEDDINLSSSDASSNVDEVLSPRSFYSESDKYSSCVESNDETATILGNLEGFDELISMLEPIPETEPQKPPVTVQKLPTQIVIQNPNNKKCISKPMISTSQIKKTQGKAKPQILKVQQISNNGNPGWLPLNIKSIKILNSPAEVAAFTGNLRKRKIENKTEDDNGVSSTNQYPPLVLSNEEKRLLAKEGISLPTHHPLTKNDERELKRIRRKIRNKISAQDSRKRKKEYVDNLEEKVRRGSEDNKNLLQRVKALQRQNKTLIAHVTKLQALICNSTTTKATPSTCLMVVLLSALLVSLPNMKLFESKHSQMQNDQEQVAVRRSLLSSPQTSEDTVNMEEFLIFKDEEEFEVRTDELDSDNSTEQEITKILEDMGKKYNDGSPQKDSRGLFGKVMETVKGFLTKDNKKELFGASDYGGYNNKRGFIEPEIDEYLPDEDPPSKRVKIELMPPLNENIVTTTVNKRKIALNTKEK